MLSDKIGSQHSRLNTQDFPWGARTRAVSGATTFHHGEWGEGTVADAMVWIGHEFHHHEHDVAQRVR